MPASPDRPPADTRTALPLEPPRRLAWNEDWLATVVGLVLVGLVLTGVLSADLVP